MAAVSFWLAPSPHLTLSELTMQLYTLTPVLGRAVCPYLSIEYHAVTNNEAQDELEAKSALGRLSVAGGDALYNRFLLRPRAHSEVEGTVQILDGVGSGEDMKHFGVTISWEVFSLWEITPSLTANPKTHALTKHPLFSKPTATITATTAASMLKTGDQPPTSTTAAAAAAPSQTMQYNTAALGSIDNPLASGLGSGLHWNGGHMRRLLCLPTRIDGSLPLLATWLDRIHLWGTSTYARGVEQDVRRAYPLTSKITANHISEGVAPGTGSGLKRDFGGDERDVWKKPKD